MLLGGKYRGWFVYAGSAFADGPSSYVFEVALGTRPDIVDECMLAPAVFYAGAAVHFIPFSVRIGRARYFLLRPPMSLRVRVRLNLKFLREKKARAL